jgi:hypothetical protein
MENLALHHYFLFSAVAILNKVLKLVVINCHAGLTREEFYYDCCVMMHALCYVFKEMKCYQYAWALISHMHLQEKCSLLAFYS